jgi:hypothetical protein
MAKSCVIRQPSLAANNIGYNMVPQRQEMPMMSDPNTASPGPNPDTGANPGYSGDWRAQRRAERDARRAARHEMFGYGRGWNGFPVGGLIVIAVGVIFLLGNFGFHLPPHWWAALLLVPAVGLLVTAIRFARVDNSFGGRAMGPAIGGVLLLAMALAIFFGLNWGLFWPIVLIAVGAAIIARRGLPRS